MYVVYILRCKDKTLYTGITTDLGRRLNEHRAGIGSSYTRSRGAERVVYSEAAPTRSTAQQREAAIKKMSRAQKILLFKKK